MNSILLIDSNQTFLDGLVKRLDKHGLSVLAAADAAAGLALFAEHRPENVVLELFLPEKDGLEVLREIKNQAPDTRVIVLSGSTFFQDYSCLHAARVFGAMATLAKEDDLEATLDRVEAVLTTPGVLFQEKRRFPRRKVNIPAVVSAPGSPSRLRGRLSDLSLHGALLLVDKTDPMARSLKDHHSLRLMLGRSRDWKSTYLCSPCRMVETSEEIQLGLTFHPLNERHLQELNCYL